jgi:hypothetical protein
MLSTQREVAVLVEDVLAVTLLLAALMCFACQSREPKQRDIVGYGPFELGMSMEEALKLRDFEFIDYGGFFDVGFVGGPQVRYRSTSTETMSFDDRDYEATLQIEALNGNDLRVESIRLEFEKLENQALEDRLYTSICKSIVDEYGHSMLQIDEYPDLWLVPPKISVFISKVYPLADDHGNVLAAQLFDLPETGRNVSIRYATKAWYDQVIPHWNECYEKWQEDHKSTY